MKSQSRFNILLLNIPLRSKLNGFFETEFDILRPQVQIFVNLNMCISTVGFFREEEGVEWMEVDGKLDSL